MAADDSRAPGAGPPAPAPDRQASGLTILLGATSLALALTTVPAFMLTFFLLGQGTNFVICACVLGAGAGAAGAVKAHLEGSSRARTLCIGSALACLLALAAGIGVLREMWRGFRL